MPFTFGGSKPAPSELSWTPETFPPVPVLQRPISQIPQSPDESTSNSSVPLKTWEKRVHMYLLHYKYKSATKPSNCTPEGISSLYCPLFLQVAQGLGGFVGCSGTQLNGVNQNWQISHDCSNGIFDGAILIFFKGRTMRNSFMQHMRRISRALDKQLFRKATMHTIAKVKHSFHPLVSCRASSPNNESEFCRDLVNGNCQFKPSRHTSWSGYICL